MTYVQPSREGTSSREVFVGSHLHPGGDRIRHPIGCTSLPVQHEGMDVQDIGTVLA